MAHEIDMTTGKAAVFVTGEPPWHRLGTVVKEAVTGSEALKLAHLDWTVEQWPIQAVKGVIRRPVTRNLANVRSDTHGVLGVVSERYRVFQNQEAFDFMDDLVGEKLAMYETAGSLQGGRRVWLLVRIPKEYRAGRDDLIKPYLLLVNTHDGSGPLRMIPTTIRVVCQNTLNLALQGTSESSGEIIRHHQCLQDRVEAARQKLGIMVRRFDQFNDEMQVLSRRSVDMLWLANYFDALLPVPTDMASQSRHEKIVQRWEENFDNPRNTLPGIRGTAWGAFNAVSEWADHQRNFRGLDQRMSDERRLNSIWFGSSDRIKQLAYSQALADVRNN